MNREITYAKTFFTVFTIGISLVFGGSLLWNINQVKNSVLQFALIEASASHEKDLLYRHWAAVHGGVYVPQTSQTPPNPYLDFVQERDLVTPSGRKLTLINPAYMTRQVFENKRKTCKTEGHITSLKPIRPENKADEWETKALNLFEKGQEECFSINEIQGKVYMRYMRPMMVEQACLKCHEAQGYKLGQVRGGISVSVPMDRYYQIKHTRTIDLILTHLIIYIAILLFTYAGFRKLAGEIKKNNAIKKRALESEANLQLQNMEFQSLNEEYKIQNEKLQQNIEKAEESERLKAAFLHNLSHEIRTPLNAIIGFSALLERPNLNEEKRKGFISIINESSNHLLNVVSDILAISFLDAKQEKVCNEILEVDSLILEMLPSYSAKAESNKISLQIELPMAEDPIKIETDKSKLSQILTHLIVNAIKFTPAGYVKIGYTIEDGYLHFFVKDSGIGIRKDQQEVIFERFRQLNESFSREFGGTGLGLTISKAYIDMLGGRIWVDSERGEGSCFNFTIPCNRNAAPQS